MKLRPLALGIFACLILSTSVTAMQSNPEQENFYRVENVFFSNAAIKLSLEDAKKYDIDFPGICYRFTHDPSGVTQRSPFDSYWAKLHLFTAHDPVLGDQPSLYITTKTDMGLGSAASGSLRIIAPDLGYDFSTPVGPVDFAGQARDYVAVRGYAAKPGVWLVRHFFQLTPNKFPQYAITVDSYCYFWNSVHAPTF